VRAAPLLASLLSLALSSCTMLRAQEGDTNTIRVTSRLVNVLVSVTDAHGAPVPNLQRGNFALLEDGHPQTLSVFEKETATPLSLVLAIDTSGSTHKDLPVEQRAARDFAHALLRPATDQLAVFDFNSDVREAVPFTADLHRIDAGLANLSRGPATAFYAAVYLAAQNLIGHGGRRVLVVISDGSNTVEGTTYDQALEQALRSETLIYSIIDVPIEADAGRDTGGEHALITLAEQTGGKYFYADSAHLDDAFRRISEDLRTQYLLGYYPHELAPNERTLAAERTAFHSISVQLSGLPAGVSGTPRYRSGYYRVVSTR
jgi:Ca-activated chloride channel homolog